MSRMQETENMMNTLRLSSVSKNLGNCLEKAKTEQPSYIDFLYGVLDYELDSRLKRAKERRLAAAAFPYKKHLKDFSLSEQKSLTRKQFNQLKSLEWIDQSYNLVLLGPSGVGKTHLVLGLGLKAIEEGYKVVFSTMGEIIRILKTQHISKKSAKKIKNMTEAHMVIIDDLMFMALDKEEANLFFHFINEIYETTSIVLTSNKSPHDWSQLIGDEIVTAAILDRIVHKSEIIQLSGESYRVKHRERIFKK